jgi:hypothetical protein
LHITPDGQVGQEAFAVIRKIRPMERAALLNHGSPTATTPDQTTALRGAYSRLSPLSRAVVPF